MRAVVLTLHHPWGSAHGGNLRTRALIEALVTLGHDVVCVHPGPAGPAPEGVVDIGTGQFPLGQQTWSAPLRAVKRRYAPMPTLSGARDRALAAALDRLAPVDLLVAGEVGAARYRAGLGAPRLWIDLPDVLSVAAVLHASSQSLLPRYTALAQARLLDRCERRAAGSADILTAAGWGDAEVLGARVWRPVRWLPTPVAIPLRPAVEPPPRTAGMLGNFAHLPNVDAYETLCRSWAPALDQLGWRVVVAGHGSDALPPSVSVERLGSVESPASFYDEVGLTLAPVRQGGGMKVKIVESLLYGRPVVAAAPALDGLPPELRRHVATADLRRPDFAPLPGALAPAPTALLGVYSPERFVDEVSGALAGLSGRACA